MVIDWRAEMQERTCAVCPAQVLRLGAFDVAERPGPQFPYDPAAGYRVGPDGTPVCVHPYRVGVPAAAYLSAGVPLPQTRQAPVPAVPRQALELPVSSHDLEGWLVAVLRSVSPRRMAMALDWAERTAAARFGTKPVVAALRRVMSAELTRPARVRGDGRRRS